jgi:hypothetical protein
MVAPTYLVPFVLGADAAIIVAVLAALSLASAHAGRPWRSDLIGAAVVLIGWFAVALSLAYADTFRGVADRLPTIQFAILIPIAIGLLLLWRSQTVARVLDIVPQSWIVGIQFYRTLGVIFILLLSTGHLPPQFALPAGWGDIAVGLLAPIVGVAYAYGVSGSGTAAWYWNIFGLLDLVVAVATGFLTSPSPFQMLSLQAPNQLISAFPLVMVPVFAVPLSVLLHAASLIKLSRYDEVRQHRSAFAA